MTSNDPSLPVTPEASPSRVSARITTSSLVVLLLAFTSYVLIGLPIGLLGIAWPSMQTSFQVPLDAMGIVLLSSTIAYTVFSSITGQLVSRLGFYRLMLVTCGLIFAGLVGESFAPVWVALLLAVFVTSIGLGMVDAGMNLLVASRFGAGVVNWLHACFGVGATIGPILMTAVLQGGLSWRIGYRLVGLMEIPLVLAIFLSRRQWNADHQDGNPSLSNPNQVERVSLFSTLRVIAVWLALLVFIIYTGFEGSAGQWSYSIMTQAREIDAAMAGFWVSVFWASLTAGRIIMGAVIDRIGVERTIRFSILVAMAGAVLFWWQPTVGVSVVGLALMGFGQASIFPSMIALTPRLVGARHTANAISLEVSVASLGGALLPGLAGILGARYGLEAIAPYLVVIVVLNWLVYEILVLHSKQKAQPGVA